MSPNRRIVLNIAATYGRSMYALVCGLFTARWVYLTLGKSDFGLYGVVGGLTVFIAFINNVLGVSVGRYYAYSVGRAKIAGREAEGLEECRQWFNTAVVLHTIVPVLLMLIGYPIGEWAVRRFLTIPPDRVEHFVWIFRFACVTCFWGMFSVPFNAMYTAKQYIAELTVYSFAQTTVNVVFLYYMVNHPGDWLVRYGLWNCLLAIVPAIIITLRAYTVFPECRFNISYMKSRRHLRELGAFAGWYSFGMLGNLCRYNTLPILINKYFGPVQNAAYGIANNLARHAQTLDASLRGAFQPAIANALGAGQSSRAMSLMYRTCKFATLLFILFAIPICLEIDFILKIWLKDPPAFTSGLAVGVISALTLEKTTTGHFIAINSNGRIAGYQVVVGLCFMASLPVAWIWMALGGSVYSVVYATNLIICAATLVRIVFLKRCLGEAPSRWFHQVFLPIFATTAASVGIGLLPRLFMTPSFVRLGTSLVVSEAVLFPLSWWVVMDGNERRYVADRVAALRNRLTRANIPDKREEILS